MKGAMGRGAIAVTICAVTLVGGSQYPAAPAFAGPALAACTYVEGDANSYQCKTVTPKMTAVSLVDCWKYPMAPRSYVSHKTAGGWVKGGAGLRAREGNGCVDPYRYRTVVTVPLESLATMVVSRYRLTMPATKGTLDDTAYDYGKTEVTYGVCLMPVTSTKPCAGQPAGIG